MDNSFDEGTNSVQVGHDSHCSVYSVHVADKVLGQLPVEVVEEEVTADACHHKVEEHHREDQVELLEEGSTEHSLEAAEA